MDKAKKDDGKKKAKLPRMGDVVFWYALKAAAAAICEKLSRGGDREKLQVGRTYPISLHVTGTANGTAIDRWITGRLARDQDEKVNVSPKGRELLAEALACLSEPERGKVVERIKRGTAKATEATRALADQAIESRREEGSRAGKVRLVPVS